MLGLYCEFAVIQGLRSDGLGLCSLGIRSCQSCINPGNPGLQPIDISVCDPNYDSNYPSVYLSHFFAVGTICLPYEAERPNLSNLLFAVSIYLSASLSMVIG